MLMHFLILLWQGWAPLPHTSRFVFFTSPSYRYPPQPGSALGRSIHGGTGTRQQQDEQGEQLGASWSAVLPVAATSPASQTLPVDPISHGQAWGAHRVSLNRRPRLLLEAGRTMKALKQPEHGRGQRGTGRQGEAMQMGTLMWLQGRGWSIVPITSHQFHIPHAGVINAFRARQKSGEMNKSERGGFTYCRIEAEDELLSWQAMEMGWQLLCFRAPA